MKWNKFGRFEVNSKNMEILNPVRYDRTGKVNSSPSWLFITFILTTMLDKMWEKAEAKQVFFTSFISFHKEISHFLHTCRHRS